MTRKIALVLLCCAVLGANLPVILAETLVQGPVSGVWTAEGNPYLVLSVIDVPNHQQLLIEPGVEIWFSANTAFYVHGQLTASGTAEDSIRFLPDGDNVIWRGIRAIDPDSVFSLDYCVITGGQNIRDGEARDTVGSGGNLFIYRGNSIISHSRIGHGQCSGVGGGVAIWDGVAQLSQTVIHDNQSNQGGGLNVRLAAEVSLDECIVHHNIASGGGGLNLEEHAQATVTNSQFLENQAVTGGGLALYGQHLVCRQTRFFGNHARMGGGAYVRNEENSALFEWCDFIENVMEGGEGSGGALISRFFVDLEVRYCRFLSNRSAVNGGAIHFQGAQQARLHHNLFMNNLAQRHGGAISATEDVGETPLIFANNTFLGNFSNAGEGRCHIGFAPGHVRFHFVSCILWGESPFFYAPNNITSAYCQTSENLFGDGNSRENPGFFELDTSWAMLRGDSPCIDSGDRNQPDDPDGTTNDRGWLYFPHDALRDVDLEEIYYEITVGERVGRQVNIRNNASVPIYVTPLENWREGERDFFFNVNNVTGDSEIKSGLWLPDGFYLAGGNSGDHPNQIYHLSRELELLNQFEQPVGEDGPGFLDLTSDGEAVMFGIESDQIIEFTTEGEYGDDNPIPNELHNGSAIAVDFNDPIGRWDFYLGDEDGNIIRANQDYLTEDQWLISKPVRGLGMKGNCRGVYAVTEENDDRFRLQIIDPDRGQVTPLFDFRTPLPGLALGGIEITQDWSANRGHLVGIWHGEGENNDWLTVMDLYTPWLIVDPDWQLLRPGEEAVWELTLAADQVEVGEYLSHFYYAVNGWGEDFQVNVRLQAVLSVASESGQLLLPNRIVIRDVFPNPFNSLLSINYSLPQPGTVRFLILNQSGQEVAALPVAGGNVGINHLSWQPGALSSGTYFLHLQEPGGTSQTKKIMYLK